MFDSILSHLFGWMKNIADYLLGFVYKAATIKAALFTGLAYVVSYLTNFITQKLNLAGSLSNLETLWLSLPDGFFFYFGVFRLDYGIPAMLAAMLVRFGIRRLPIVG